MNAVRLLLWTTLSVPLLALWPQGQDAAADDWAAHVQKACTSPRYGLRLAAARKLAEGGDAPVPAIRDWARQHGRNQLPAALVDAIADADPKAHGPAVLALLREWSEDADFFWRAAAMRGLALRAAATAAPGRHELAAWFARCHDDPAWLMRTHARLGSALLDDPDAASRPEADPRARVRLAALLLGQGRVPPLQPLLDALADERTFRGDPWGRRLGAEAHKALKAWLGEAHPLADGGSFADKPAAITALLAAAAAKSGQSLQPPVPRTDPATPFTGGIEILSCKHGDVFVQWTAAGEVFAGLDAETEARLPAEVWQRLTQARAALPLGGDLGVVICDSMRLEWRPPDVHVKVAPGSLPAAAAIWLEQLARAVEEAGCAGLGRDLRTALTQFAGR
ncbi:MAG: hypothetical protein KF830_06375 [Planctomycetes bacterium]|nr:hypothetical protein [Planctomycetota bacterium]